MEYFRVRSRAGLGVAALFAATVLSGAAWADADLSGIYWATEYHPKIQCSSAAASCRSPRRARPPMRRTWRA